MFKKFYDWVYSKPTDAFDKCEAGLKKEKMNRPRSRSCSPTMIPDETKADLRANACLVNEKSLKQKEQLKKYGDNNIKNSILNA